MGGEMATSYQKCRMKREKQTCLFCFVFGLHYLCKRKAATRTAGAACTHETHYHLNLFIKKMNKLFFITLFLCSASVGLAQETKSGNPIFEGWYADPEGVIWGKEYWIYPTYSGSVENPWGL